MCKKVSISHEGHRYEVSWFQPGVVTHHDQSNMWRKEKKTQEGANNINLLVAEMSHYFSVLIHYILSDNVATSLNKLQ